MSNGVQKGKDNALAVQQWIAELDAVGDYGECGVMNIDRNLIDITDDTIENIDLGYVITIHKSQGSQWSKCIFMLPSYASRMTVQSLMYTAVTRPSRELVMMGYSSLIKSAIEIGNSSLKRITNIAPFLCPDRSAGE
ncbi:ATP-binding domain-containing protein [Aeromonas veronii]|uniref:ATP-binding domain-containing protein n=1 Tax=Aeromonas veronii TaxID=654 RepID=UPI000E1E5660|nr:ATP-binding domain-containing protein [Aeromonas veronii]RDU78055.1 hypothetical protein CHF44_20840 [Aeromonas veronii]RDU90091.1 hypothetical protein CHH34_19245 [Aeromonas veronii]TEY59352.1 hypothetical protein CIG15_20255 [Aeromonas veronii]